MDFDAFNRFVLVLVLVRVLVISILTCSASIAEVTVDGSFGSVGSLSGPNFEITADLGKQVDRNLFHSFQSFNINSSQSATFSGPDSIANILSRVTGGESSTIDGLLRSTIPGADFYFLNPAGVLFGPNASLDVQGSFHVSTADFIRMEDGVVFNALPSPEDSVLSTAPPAAFGFLEEDPADISIQESIIEVPEGETFSIVGGDIEIREGSLSAPSGQINLVSTGSVGEAPFDGTDLSVGEFQKRGYITIADNGLIDTRGESGGRIFIRGGQIKANNSEINATALSDGDGRGIDIAVTDQLNLIDTVVRSSTRSEGNAGNLDIQSGEFSLQDSSVFGSTFAAGRAGDVAVTATGSINLSGESFITSNTLDSDDAGNSGAAGRVSISASSLDLEGSNIESVSGSDSTGDAGEIQINVDNLVLRDSAQIDSSTLSSGQGGSIAITASEDIRITGRPNEETQTGLFSVTNKTGEGGNLTVSAGGSIVMDGGRILTRTLGDANAGILTVNANDLTLTNGAQIFAGIGNLDVGNTEGLGNGGDVFITASETLSISGTDPEAGFASGIFSTAQVGKGDSGDLTVAARELQIRNGAEISVNTFSSGNSGALTIDAEKVSLSGDGNSEATGIFAQANIGSSGDAGKLTIKAADLEVRNGAEISAGTFSSGNSGTLLVDANRVLLSGDGASNATGIFAQAGSRSSGDGGNLTINASELEVLDGAQVGASTFSSGNSGALTVDANRVMLSRDGSSDATGIFAQANQESTGNAGNLTIKGASLEVRNGAEVSASTFSSGNSGILLVDVDRVLLSGDGASNVTGIFAQANPESSGDAGNLTIKSASLEVRNEAEVGASTFSSGNSGTLLVDADRVLLSGDGASNVTGIFAQANPQSSGDAGNLTIKAADLEVRDGGVVSARTFGAGDSGELLIAANSVLLAGSGSALNTGIFSDAQAESSGNAQTLSIIADSLAVRDGAIIGTGTFSSGEGGEINITAHEIFLAAGGTSGFTGIGSLAGSESSGNAGDITITTNTLELTNGAEISASTRSTGNGGNATINATNIRLVDGGRIAATSTGTDQEIQNDRNVGRSGNISITASDSLTIESGGTVTVETEAANAGNIKLQVERLLLLRDQGAITTSAAVAEGIGGQGNGGNITIDPDFVVLDNGSTIQANALEGMAGVVVITADFFFQSPDSVVQASAGPAGIDGTVNINSPVVNIAESVAVLPESFFDASQQLSERCSARVGGLVSSFVAVGRGGLPIGPDDLAPAIALGGASTAQSSSVDLDWGKNTESSNNLAQANARSPLAQADDLKRPSFAKLGFGCRE